ncbi:MAG: hypothetical protein ABW044_00080 [Cellvibrio sp.]
MNTKTFTGMTFAFIALCAPFSFAQTLNTNISEADVKAAQDAWGNALIQISTDYDNGGLEKAKATAKAVLDSAYAYNAGPVLFKPTLSGGEQTFRTDYRGALSYFVGDDKLYPQDKGFALKSWKGYSYKNAAVYINGDSALTMGHVIFTDKNGKVTTVDKTWGFKKGDDGKIRIVLHHSSIPYSAK